MSKISNPWHWSHDVSIGVHIRLTSTDHYASEVKMEKSNYKLAFSALIPYVKVSKQMCINLISCVKMTVLLPSISWKYFEQHRHVHLGCRVVYLSTSCSHICMMLVQSVFKNSLNVSRSSIFYSLTSSQSAEWSLSYWQFAVWLPVSRMKPVILVVCGVIAASLTLPFADNKLKEKSSL